MILAACKHEHTKKFGKNRMGNPRMRCTLCGKTWTIARPSSLGNMRIDLSQAESIIKHLCEGTSVRATARLLNVSKNTILDLMILVGERCSRYLQLNLRNVAVEDVQVDEVWQYIYCKEKAAQRMGFGPEVGDSYCFVGIERNTKLILAWHFGKRDQWNTEAFCQKLRTATAGKFQLNSDGFDPYRSAVVRNLGDRVSHGIVVKTFGKTSQDDQRKYSPARIVSMKREAAWNLPDMKRVCTSHIERSNLNMRTFIRRMTRLSNGFSKKWANHEAMLALYIAHYNYVRIHGKLKTTPAVASGVEDHRWPVRELIERTATT
jgi:transposase-like protein/IS1 family transposase